MSQNAGQTRKVVPAQLGFLAIYNPSLGTTDETLENQIVYYSSTESRQDTSVRRSYLNPKAIQDAIQEQNNEQLRQIGLAQGMVEFGRSFSDGKSVDTIETEKCRIILHELEMGWWILASINLTVLPGTTKTKTAKGKSAEEKETIEYSSREVKPAILLLGDLLRAHATFLLHHASSMSALFVRTRRSKFMGILGRYWDTYLSTWNVLMHGNPANSLYGGIKIAACGELGMGVGEEERGSGEREVLEGFVGRIEGLVDVMVSRFGKGNEDGESDTPSKMDKRQTKPSEPWLGSGDEPSAEDGVIFLGTGALSRKSLRDVSHWVEDLYRWGPSAYGVVDNPTSNRRTKKAKGKAPSRPRKLSPDAKTNSRQVYGLSLRDKVPRRSSSPGMDAMTIMPPTPVTDDPAPQESAQSPKSRHSFHRGPSSVASTNSESNKGNRFVQYLKLGYGTQWSLGSSLAKEGPPVDSHPANKDIAGNSTGDEALRKSSANSNAESKPAMYPEDDSTGHYLIGLMGNMEDEGEGPVDDDPESFMQYQADDDAYSARLLLRTLTVELEREEDARAETEISIDLGNTDNDRVSSKTRGSEHTATSNASFESQDRNKTKKLRVVVYVNKPFVFVFMFELRTDGLALSSLYRSLHYQIAPLIKPLLTSTSFRASRPDVYPVEAKGSSTPIYDLVWDPRLLTLNSTIPNIPDPYLVSSNPSDSLPWSRIEALNTHMQIVNTYIASTSERAEMDRTCKTSRGWWVVYCRVPDVEPATTSLASGTVRIPRLITKASVDSQTAQPSALGAGTITSGGTSTFGASLNSGPAHPFLETRPHTPDFEPKEKEIFLIRRASDYVAAMSSSRFASGQSMSLDAGWASGPGRLAQGIGVDTKRYIEGLLNISR